MFMRTARRSCRGLAGIIGIVVLGVSLGVLGTERCFRCLWARDERYFVTSGAALTM